MRHLYRGKRIDNGEWVEGDFITDRAKGVNRAWIGIVVHGQLAQIEVNPETVGQYTGLDDKNGVKIFEGDKVNGMFIVYWSETCMGWRLRTKSGNEKFYWHEFEGFEVVGDIHNPINPKA